MYPMDVPDLRGFCTFSVPHSKLEQLATLDDCTISMCFSVFSSHMCIYDCNKYPVNSINYNKIFVSPL